MFAFAEANCIFAQHNGNELITKRKSTRFNFQMWRRFAKTHLSFLVLTSDQAVLSWTTATSTSLGRCFGFKANNGLWLSGKRRSSAGTSDSHQLNRWNHLFHSDSLSLCLNWVIKHRRNTLEHQQSALEASDIWSMTHKKSSNATRVVH